MKKNISLISNILLILISVAFLYAYGKAIFFPQQKSVQTGELAFKNFVPNLPEGATLIAAMSSTCPHCIKTLPQYADLANKFKSGGGLVVTAFPSGDLRASSFLNRKVLALGDTLTAAFYISDLRITGTPTFLVVNHQGIVLNHWEGELTPLSMKSLEKVLPIGPPQYPYVVLDILK